MDYLKKEELRKRFILATKKTSLSEKYFKEHKGDPTIIEIGITLGDENGRLMSVKKEYSNIEELEKFIDVLEKVKIISQNPKYQVQIIPKSTYIDIYINDTLITDTNVLTRYVETTRYDIKREMDNIIDAITSKSRKIGLIYKEINDEQSNIERCKELIKNLKSNMRLSKKRKLINFKRMGKFGSIIHPNDYKINWDEIVKSINEYTEAYNKFTEDYNNKNSKEELEKTEDKLKEIYNEMINAIKSGRTISKNLAQMPSNLDALQLKRILNYFKTFSESLDNMPLEAQNVLDSKTKEADRLIEKIDTALTYRKNKAIKKISSINIDKEPEIKTSEISITLDPTEDYAAYNKGSFNFEINSTAEVFKQIQKQQLELLTPKERDALIYYKSALYRPINKIIAFLNKYSLSLEEVEKDKNLYNELIKIISSCYDSFIKSKKELKSENINIEQRRENEIQSQPHSAERLFGKYPDMIPSRTEYTKIVLESIPLLKSALNKIELPEDIIVYRVTHQKNYHNPTINKDGRFLSTTISLETIREFLKDRKEKNKPIAEISQILIPKGSKVIVFTDDFFTDEYQEGRTFNDPQKEILIDPTNFDLKVTYSNSNSLEDGTIIDRTNYIAIPKIEELEQSHNNTR